MDLNVLSIVISILILVVGLGIKLFVHNLWVKRKLHDIHKLLKKLKR